MSQWLEVVHPVDDRVHFGAGSWYTGAIRLSPSPRAAVRLRRLRRRAVHLLRTLPEQVQAAFARAGREEKVALLGLALVLAVLSWP